MRIAVILLLIVVCPGSAYSQLQILTWNVESDGADPAVIAKQLQELPKNHIFALQEVGGNDIGRYGDALRQAHGKSYRFLASWTGRSDRLMIAFDSARLTLWESREMFQQGSHQLNDWRHRSPLVCLFEDRQTGKRFFFVTVHLARGNAKLREQQAAGLREWAAKLEEPVIAAGDFNFDYSFTRKRGNKAFETFLKEGVWHWAKPQQLIDTNWADRDRDGKDNYPDSCLDFVFFSGGPPEWNVESEVLVRAGDFPDSKSTSDHRPITAQIQFAVEDARTEPGK